MNKKRKSGILFSLIFCFSILLSACGENSVLSSSQTRDTSQYSVSSSSTSPSPTVSPSPSPISSPSPSPSPIPVPSPSPSLAPKAEQKSPSIELVKETSPVRHGSSASITVKGQPNTDYDITVNYKSGPSTAAGLVTKTSNSSGEVSWTWKVGTRTTPGTWSITISGGGDSETYDFDVT